MATQTILNRSANDEVPTASFDRFGGICAILAGIGGLLYAIAFVIISRSAPALGGLLSALFLTLNGLLASSALATLYQRLRSANATAALWALLLGSAGALGAAIHGGYDLANALNPPSAVNADLPSQIDPRGLLTFGVAGIALLVNAWLIAKDGTLPRSFGYLTYVLAALLLFIYLARLTILSPANPVLLVPVLLSGFLVNPAWYIWLGLTLFRSRAA
ncbi:MAG TPA: hypothetical protein VKE41_18885 [Roseiflexaceae bacterium]|nr:hypothetical protein [Roseiflexaceae bacterium]